MRFSRHGIATARYQTFTDATHAKQFVQKEKNMLVVKASGLAAGKGVMVATSSAEACDQIDVMLGHKMFGKAGEVIVVEELLLGQEVSVLAFSDGKTVRLMPPAQDHKRAFEGDQGPNTGGMGAYAPCPFLSAEMQKQVETDVIQKAINGLQQEGMPFVGVLYAGLILTDNGPKVLEFNCRFGDPETQSVLSLLESDLYDICSACARGNLNEVKVQWNQNKFACGVVIASGGYPASATKGVPIFNLAEAEATGVQLFHGGTEVINSTFLTSGGRVLTVVGVADTLEEAVRKAQEGAKIIGIEKSFYRTDIAAKALKRSVTYKSSGVDIDAGERLVDDIKLYAKKTVRSGVMESIGGFGALFDLKAAGYDDPILVSGTDGVGTKLKIAIETKIYDTVGIDLVAMCVNDILVQGAEPLYYLDYFACSKLEVPVASKVISGIAKGCQESNCALVGMYLQF